MAIRNISMMQFDNNTSVKEIKDWLRNDGEILWNNTTDNSWNFSVMVTTKDGYEEAKLGDFIIHDENGFYVLEKDIIEQILGAVKN